MSTVNTAFRNYVFPLKDEDLEASNALLNASFDMIDQDVQKLFDEKANTIDVDTSATVDNKISSAIGALDIYGTYSGDVYTDPIQSNKLIITDVFSTPGTWTKVTVNTKGQITFGANITLADITDYSAANYLSPSDILDTSIATNKLWSSTKISNELGLMVPLSSYTDLDILTKIKNVDGSTSGLDSDLLDGQDGTYYLNWANFTGTPTTIAGYGITDAISFNSINNLTSSLDTVIDFSISEVTEILLDSNGVFTASGLTNGQRGNIIIKQDAIGSRTITFPIEFKFPGGVTPTLSTGPNSIDNISYVISGTDILCDFSQAYA